MVREVMRSWGRAIPWVLLAAAATAAGCAERWIVPNGSPHYAPVVPAPPWVGDAGFALPSFPWPPPQASGEAVVPARLLGAEKPGTTLADAARTLGGALASAGYEERWAFLAVPRGFALVTHLEQIGSDGRALAGRERWSDRLPSLGAMSFFDFVKALIRAPAGSYRTFVFVVTDEPWARTAPTATGRYAQAWFRSGANRLPNAVGALPYGPSYETRALVYEFTKEPGEADAPLVQRRDASAAAHLRFAGITDALGSIR